MKRFRIWSETLAHDELVGPRVVALLRSYGVAPIVAVWPSTEPAMIARILGVFADAGLPAAIWPMLEDREGRWMNAGNAAAFARFVRTLMGAPGLGEIVIDLEPAIAEVRRLVSGPLGADPTAAHELANTGDRRALERAEATLAALVDELHGRGVRVSAAVVPTVLLDPPRDRPGPWQEVLGTPVDGVAWDHLSVMLYSSIVEGWSRGLFRRADARAWLAASARAAIDRFGDRAGVSLGAVGTGALGDEPIYRGPDELADDVALARAAGADDLALFDLGGVIRRGPPEAWLDALTRPPRSSAVPPPTLRVRAAIAGARAAGGVFGAMTRLRDRAARLKGI